MSLLKKVGYEPATEKQINFLKNLLDIEGDATKIECVYFYTKEKFNLAQTPKWLASAAISHLLNPNKFGNTHSAKVVENNVVEFEKF